MLEEHDEYLVRCVVDTSTRTFNLYSNMGDEKVVKCDNMNEFMNALSFVRTTLDEDKLVYANPL
jgi:imidazoleglycerol phosphate dehydratase HisB